MAARAFGRTPNARFESAKKVCGHQSCSGSRRGHRVQTFAQDQDTARNDKPQGGLAVVGLNFSHFVHTT